MTDPHDALRQPQQPWPGLGWQPYPFQPRRYYPAVANRSSFHIQVGRLLCRHMRDMLRSEQFAGRRIQWLESKGLFERLFTVTGEAEDVWKIAERITAWARNINAVDYHGP
jgi:hypothetical protein